jgi:hypothetical protein
VRKELPNSYVARSFFLKMDRAGRNPRVVAKQAG